MKINRKTSYILIAIVYIIAMAAGLVTYRLAVAFPIWARLLIADVVATVVTFVFSSLFSNASVYDPYWSVAPIVIAYAFLFSGFVMPAKILLVVAISVWGIRLTANWAYTFHGLDYQDWRYTMLKEKTGRFYPFVNFFGIHLVPTLVVYACMLPAVEVLTGYPTITVGGVICFICILGAIALQGVADCQMHSFRKKGTGGFIRTGVWKYSRHPNYLAEILTWWGVAAFASFSLGFSWLHFIGAIANTCLFLFISIPMAEQRQARKVGFDKYKRQTRMLLPIYKKQ